MNLNYLKSINKQKTYISFPKVLLGLMSEKEHFTIVEFFYQLKSVTNCGCIKNYRKKYAFLSGKTGLSETTLRRRIGLLKEKGLVRVEKGNLFLESKYDLIDYFGYNNKNNKNTNEVIFNTIKLKKNNALINNNVIIDNEFYFDGIVDDKIKNVGTMRDKLVYENKMYVNPSLIVNKCNKENIIRDFHNVKHWNNNVIFDKNVKVEKGLFKYVIYAYLLNNNIEQQKEFYKDKHIQKILDNKSTEKYKGATSYHKKRYSIASKEVEKNLEFLIKEDQHTVCRLLLDLENKDNYNKINEFLKSKRNPFFTLSRQGTSKSVGFKSKSKGSSIIKKLKEMNLIESDKKHEYSFNDKGILINDLLENDIYNKLGKIYYSNKNKSSMLKLSNEISFNLFSMNYDLVDNAL